MKKNILLYIILLMSIISYGQDKLFEEVPLANVQMSSKESIHYQKLSAQKFIKEIRIIKIDLNQFRNNAFQIAIDKKITTVNKTDYLKYSLSDYSWFGKLTDETGIFFSVINGQVASKFYLDQTSYTIIPLNNSYHLLISYNDEINQGKCGNDINQKNISPENKHSFINPGINKITLDNNCRMRVLLVITAQAEPEIPMSLQLAARMLEDESNLAYQQSLVNYRMEIARVVRTNYVETTAWQGSTEYGLNADYPTDLLNLRSGAGLLNNIPALRENYKADVVVMVRSDATNSAQGFYGIALGVPVDPYAPSDQNAFALISTIYMVGGRFTFAHEIGHIQGCRHDNHDANPVYARGYVFSTGLTNNRDIMAIGCGNDPSTGCRIQFFSNPNITFGGVPIGIPNQRDNVRRINETANNVLNFRLTSSNLLLVPENYESGILARQLSNSTISTNFNTIIVQSQSRVSMRAGSSVLILPGFQANNGSSFIAYIGNCSDQPLLKPETTSDFTGIDYRTNNSVNKKSFEVLIFPNPAQNLLTVKIKNIPPTQELNNSNYEFFVVNKLNNVLLKKSFSISSSIFRLNISILNSGSYFLITKKGGESVATPFIVIK